MAYGLAVTNWWPCYIIYYVGRNIQCSMSCEANTSTDYDKRSAPDHGRIDLPDKNKIACKLGSNSLQSIKIDQLITFTWRILNICVSSFSASVSGKRRLWRSPADRGHGGTKASGYFKNSPFLPEDGSARKSAAFLGGF